MTKQNLWQKYILQTCTLLSPFNFLWNWLQLLTLLSYCAICKIFHVVFLLTMSDGNKVFINIYTLIIWWCYDSCYLWFYIIYDCQLKYEKLHLKISLSYILHTLKSLPTERKNRDPTIKNNLFKSPIFINFFPVNKYFIIDSL